MKSGRPLLLAVLAALAAAGAMGEYYMRVAAPRRKSHVEEIRMAEPFAGGTLVFRAENKKTKAVLSVYETPLAPDAALSEIGAALISGGWRQVFSTASMIIFENASGKCTAAEAYEADGATRAAVLMQR